MLPDIDIGTELLKYDKDKFEDEEEVIELTIIEVEKDCELAKRVEEKGFTYIRGCAYYQFTRKEELIDKDKVIIFQSTV